MKQMLEPPSTIQQMKDMPLNHWFSTECFIITRVPGGWLYSRNWDAGVGAHTVFVPEPKGEKP